MIRPIKQAMPANRPNLLRPCVTMSMMSFLPYIEVHHFLFTVFPSHQQQRHQQDRLPEATPIPPLPTRSAFISTSSCPSPSSPPHTHSSRRRPPPPPPSYGNLLPPPVPPRLAIHPTSSFDCNDV